MAQRQPQASREERGEACWLDAQPLGALYLKCHSRPFHCRRTWFNRNAIVPQLVFAQIHFIVPRYTIPTRINSDCLEEGAFLSN